MSRSEKPEKFPQLLNELLENPESIPWAERLTLAGECFRVISSGPSSVSAVKLAVQLAYDSKWEVRKEVADNLLLFPEDDFLKVAAILKTDTNSFVLKSLKRALDRRRRGQRHEKARKKKLSLVKKEYSKIEESYGEKAAEKAMFMAEQFYNTLVGSVVHDMRNILSPLRSGIFSLQEEIFKPDSSSVSVEQKLKKLEKITSRMEHLLDDMKNYFQPLELKTQTERLSPVLESACEMSIDALKGSSILSDNVSVNISVKENITLEISRHQIELALANIIKNAYESYSTGPGTFKPGTVKISAIKTDDDNIEIAVADNGVGLSAAELEKILNFVPGGSSKGENGTGFGLPMAKRIVEAHNGSINIESQENIGTTVLITLPLEQEREDEA